MTRTHLSEQELQRFRELLETQRQKLETELSGIAQKDTHSTEGWGATFPSRMSEGSTSLEEAADEVEEYSTRLNIEQAFEQRIKDINDALEKIQNGTYGICEKTGKPIPKERLEAYPEARTC